MRIDCASLHEVWSYVRVHLELYVATQRLGLISSTQWFPTLQYFIPFTANSPIQAPPPIEDFSPGSILQWLSSLFISTTPFLVWVMAQRMIRDWKPQIWARISKHLPNTASGKKIPRLPSHPTNEQSHPEESGANERASSRTQDQIDDTSPSQAIDGRLTDDAGPIEAVRRPSIFSARGDDGGSDDEDNEGISRTLISFDVEATESSDAPVGLWSAELRPSLGNDPRQVAGQQPVYIDTALTQLPAAIASHIFTDAVSAILTAPYEAMALRLVARTLRIQRGLPFSDIYNISLFSGLSWTFAINLVGVELLHLILSGEVWAAFTTISQYYHMSEEEWKKEEEDSNAGRLGD